MPAQQALVREWSLQACQEYRFETGPLNEVVITLQSGTAEIFGTELALRHPYTFASNEKLAIFTWEGAVLERAGEGLLVEYVSSEEDGEVPVQRAYLKTHLSLQVMRSRSPHPPKVPSINHCLL